MKPNGVVTLLTDFGLVDSYVAAMKGVLLSMAPAATLVDISHLVPRHDIAAGAYVLASAAPNFPEGTVHLAVVDPGVGSSRAAVALRTQSAWYVGPDNGLLWQAAGESVEELVIIDRVPGYTRPRSSTFHGRDLFAPAAGHIVRGGELSELGAGVHALSPLEVPWARRAGHVVEGVVVHVDGFGNIVTNIRREDLPESSERVVVKIEGVLIRGLVTCYDEVPEGTLCALFGSEDRLEISVSSGSASKRLGVDRGAGVVCRVIEEP